MFTGVFSDNFKMFGEEWLIVDPRFQVFIARTSLFYSNHNNNTTTQRQTCARLNYQYFFSPYLYANEVRDDKILWFIN